MVHIDTPLLGQSQAPRSSSSARWIIAVVISCFALSLTLNQFEHDPRERLSTLSSSNDHEPLLLTPLIEAGLYSRARSLSTVLIDEIDLGHSGFFSVASREGVENNLFFFYQPCIDCEDVSKAPLIQYFNGGPGSPDTVGLFNQIGRYYVNSDMDLKERCHTLCKKNSCLFVDSPVGTGYSFQKGTAKFEPTLTSEEVGKQISDLLTQFLQVFPSQLNTDFYVSGLSYAGHYVPHFGIAVLDREDINFKGVLVGDPAMYHEMEIPEYAGVFKALGLVDDWEEEKLRQLMKHSLALSESGDCTGAFNAWNKVFNDDGGSSCAPDCEFLFSAWTGSDNTEHALLAGQPKEFDYFRKFLKLPGVEDSFHVSGSPNAGNSNATMSEGGEVYTSMVASGDFCENTTPFFAQLLKSGIDVFITVGNMDVLLGPAPVGEAVKNGLLRSWGAGALEEFLAKPKEIWRVDGKVKGYTKCVEREAVFCFVVVRGAGHEVASYQPEANYDAMRRLMDKDFQGWGEGGGDMPNCKEGEGGVGPLIDL